jgi:hypothetical protein
VRLCRVLKSALPLGALPPSKVSLADVPSAKKKQELLPREEEFAKALFLAGGRE